MKNELICILSLLLSSTLFSQTIKAPLQDYLINEAFKNQRNTKNIAGNDLTLAKGSQFKYEDFVNGKILKDNKPIIENIPLRYDILNDIVQAKNKDGIILETIKESSISFQLGNETYYYIPTKNGFFNILTKNENVNLLKKTSIEYIPEKAPRNSYDSGKSAKVEQVEIFYIKDKNENFHELHTSNRNNFLRAFSSNDKTIKDYIKSNKLNIKKEVDLVKIINHYNSIIE